MDTAQFVFLIGNKRSGTTHLVELLNLHPSVFISHESDAIWILYQATKGKEFRAYPWDGQVGMQATLEACDDLLQPDPELSAKPGAVQDLFLRMQDRLMKHGSRIQKPYTKKRVRWTGDKKPVQQADPDIMKFIHKHFSGARFIHLVRHPRAVVSSMLDAARTWGKVGYWSDLDQDELLERWAIHEEWALAAKSQYGSIVHSLRHEDLCHNPAEQMRAVFAFLDLESDRELDAMISSQTRSGEQNKHKKFILPESERADKIMKQYGYAR